MTKGDCDMKHFLYVFNENDRNTLLSLGYKLIRENKTRNTYIFENQEVLRFNCNQVSVLQSDVLIF